MDVGYVRVSTTKQDLDRQIDARRKEGISAKRIYVDKKSGASTNRPGLQAALDHAREGDVIVVHTLDRLGRTVRDTRGEDRHHPHQPLPAPPTPPTAEDEHEGLTDTRQG